MPSNAPLATLPLLHSIFEGAPDAILVVDPSGAIVLANGAAVALFGYPRAELIGTSVDALVPTITRSTHAEHRSEFDRHPSNRAMGAGRHLSACRKDGALVPVDISLTKVDLAEGGFVIAIARDVTVYRRFLEACPIAIFVAEHQRITYANPAGRALIGTEDGDRLGSEALGDIIHPDDRSGPFAALTQAIAEGGPTPAPLEIRIVRCGGEVRYVETTGVVVPNTGVPTTLLAMQDVTERRRAAERARSLEVALQQQQRLADIGAVTTRIVHDVANPVAGLIMGTQRTLQMLDRLPAEVATPVRPSVDRVLTTSRHLAALLQDFKDFSRQQRLALCDVVLSEFFDELEGAWSGEAAARDIRLTWTCPDGTVLAADRLKLRRAFDNLVKNALEAIDHGPGDIAIAVATEPPAKVAVTISDSGGGIPEGTNPFALFETTKPNGTGLGLPSVKQIVEAHGGTIELVSEPRRGAVFRMVLPTRQSR